MPITASYSAATRKLSAIGSAVEENIVFNRNVAGQIFVNGGAVPVSGGTPTVANTDLIEAFGLDLDDVISLDETNGILPAADLFGGKGRAWLRAQDLPGDEQEAVEQHIQEYDRLTEVLKGIERDIARAALADPNVTRLMTIPGIDMVVAVGAHGGDRSDRALLQPGQAGRVHRAQPECLPVRRRRSPSWPDHQTWPVERPPPVGGGSLANRAQSRTVARLLSPGSGQAWQPHRRRRRRSQADGDHLASPHQA